MRKRIDQLHIYTDDLKAMQIEQDNEFKNVISKISNINPENMIDFLTILQNMLDTIDKEKAFFSEQIELIKTISPLMSEYLDYSFSIFENFQLQLNNELRSKKFLKMENMNSESLNQMQYIDELVYDLSKCYDELYNTISTSYNCFGGMLNFIEDIGDKQNTKKKPTKQKKKNVK